MQNEYLKARRGEHYKSLVRQAKEHEETLEKSPKVEKGSVEQALTAKIELAHIQTEDLKRMLNIIVCYAVTIVSLLGRLQRAYS